MPRNRDFLDRISIPKPCPADWAEMIGDDRSRYCQQCDKKVYNLSAMTVDQVHAVLEAKGARLCGRIERGPDGKVIVKSPLPPVSISKRRPAAIASAVVSALIGLGSNTICYGTGTQPIRPSYVSRVVSPDEQQQSGELASKLVGRVHTESGVSVGKAKVTAVNETSGEERTVTTDSEGFYEIPVAGSGSYTILVESSDFGNSETEGITVGKAESRSVDFALKEQRLSVVLGGAMGIPRPLRQSFKASALVVVARWVNSKTVATEDDRIFVRSRLAVSEVLRGSCKKTVDVYHWIDEEEAGPFNNTDDFLIFLNRPADDPGKTAPGYEFADYRFPMKVTDQDPYLLRVRELATLEASAEPNSADLVEWLVKCAVDPATRWHGAVELASNKAKHSAAEDEKTSDDAEEEASETADKADESQPNSEITKLEVRSELKPLEVPRSVESNSKTRSPQFRDLLTEDQKERLIDALWQSDGTTDGDAELINLFTSLHDQRIATYLMRQLNRITESDDNVTRWMSWVADYFDSEYLRELESEYYRTYVLEQTPEADQVAHEKQQRVIRKFLIIADAKYRKAVSCTQ
ncbi:MAG TPA: carboxypeptidase regulatory-like domain-containing protein [Blastocatellia bacterium]|nr:carboxypeptidase regulatory-like domain-containing protein [Blastocatellia bacterium]